MSSEINNAIFHRDTLSGSQGDFSNSLLEQMNLKLTQVVSEITGVTGMAILQAIIAGERDPQRLAKLRNPHCHHDAEAIAKALQGTWRAEHLFA
jgi:hypothetical protein